MKIIAKILTKVKAYKPGKLALPPDGMRWAQTPNGVSLVPDGSVTCYEKQDPYEEPAYLRLFSIPKINILKGAANV